MKALASSFAAGALLAIGLGDAARGATLLPLEQDRGVYAESGATSSNLFASDRNADEASDFSDYAAAVSSSGASAGAQAAASAELLANLLPAALGARSEVASSASTLAADERALASSDAAFRLVFESDTTESFWLQGSLSAVATGAQGESHALVELVDLGTGLPLARFEARPGEAQSFSDTGTLVSGVSYRLAVVATARPAAPGGADAASGQASAELLLAVPEPARALQLACGAGALALLARLRGGLGR